MTPNRLTKGASLLTHVTIKDIHANVVFLLQRVRRTQHENDRVHPGDRFLQPDQPGIEYVSQDDDDECNHDHQSVSHEAALPVALLIRSIAPAKPEFSAISDARTSG